MKNINPIVVDAPGGVAVVWPIGGHATQADFERKELEKMGLDASKIVPVKPTRLPWDLQELREAWTVSGKSVTVCPVKSKAICHERRRALRQRLLSPLDALATSPDEALAENARRQKRAILDDNAAIQARIDALESPAEMLAAVKQAEQAAQ